MHLRDYLLAGVFGYLMMQKKEWIPFVVLEWVVVEEDNLGLGVYLWGTTT